MAATAPATLGQVQLLPPMGRDVVVQDFLKLDSLLLRKISQLFLDKTLKVLCVLEFLTTKAIELKTYRLDGFAKKWFETLQMGRSVVLLPFGWEEFSEAFRAKFLPANKRQTLL